MSNLLNKKCCSSCQNGKPGGNTSCQAKLLVAAKKKTEADRVPETKNESL